MADDIKENEEVTLTIWGSLATTKSNFRAYNSGGSVMVATLTDNGNGTYSSTFKWKIGTSLNTQLYVYAFTNAQTGTSTIDRIKLERGNIATDWTEAPEDAEARMDENITSLGEEVSNIASQIANKAEAEALNSMIEEYNERISQAISDREALAGDLATLAGRTALVETIAGDNKLVTSFIDTVITESDEGIFISTADGETGVLISEERISFLDGGTEVAYISNQTMEITHGIFVESATISGFKFEKIPNTEILSITWVGTD